MGEKTVKSAKIQLTPRILAVVVFTWLALAPASAAADTFPSYKPSSRSPAPVDIRLNEYGANRSAPDALQIGDAAPDFAAPRAGGGIVTSRTLRREGAIVLIFYRGHW